MGSGKKPPPEGVGPPTSSAATPKLSAGGSTPRPVETKWVATRQPHEEAGRTGEQGTRGKASQKQEEGNEASASASPGKSEPPRKAWTGAEASRALFAKTEQVKAARPTYPDEVEHADAYARARKQYNVFPLGRQRAPTAEELHAEFLWRTGAIHLEDLPGHFKQTRTVKQRARALAFMRKCGYSVLYLPPPPGFKLRQYGARFQLNVTLLGMNENGEVTDPVALDLLAHVHSIHIAQNSIEFWFVRPEDAAKFAGKALRLPGGTVQLLATESFTTEDPGHGFDDVAMKLLYEIKLIGGDREDAEDILAIGEHICAGIEIVDLKADKCTTSSASEVLQDTCWTFTLASMSGPPGLANVRELEVTLGEKQLVFGVHQPRLAKFPPCPVCLHDWHTRQKCPHKESTSEAVEKRQQLRAPRRLAIVVPEPTKFPRMPKPESPATYAAQVAHEYILLEPEMAKAQATVAKLAEAATAALLDATRAQAKLEATEREVKAATVAREEAAEADGVETPKKPTDSTATDAKAKARETNLTAVTAKPQVAEAKSTIAAMKTTEEKKKTKQSKSKASPAAKSRATRPGEAATDSTKSQLEQTSAAQSFGEQEGAVEPQTGVASVPTNGLSTKATAESGADSLRAESKPSGTLSSLGQQDAADADMELDEEQTEFSKTSQAVKMTEAPTTGEVFNYVPPPRPRRSSKATLRAKRRAARAQETARALAETIAAATRTSRKSRATSKTTDDRAEQPDTDSDFEDEPPQPTAPQSTATVDDQNVGEKRARVATIDDPSAAMVPDEKPPTRQARANTAQATVISATAKSLIRAKARAANARAAAEGGPRQRQLSVTPFLQPAHVGGEQEDADMDCREEEPGLENLATISRDLTEEEWRTITFDAFKSRLGLREVETPTDGHCLQSSVHAMKAASCAVKLPHTRAVRSETNYWRKGIAQHLSSALATLVANGSIALADASHSFLGTAEVDDMTVPRIIEHLKLDAAKTSYTPASERFWGTGFHIMALVHWCREPVYVLSVVGPATADRAWEMIVQRYYYKPADDGVGTETLSVAETVAQLKLYKLKKVLPLLLVLRHKTDANGRNASHFQALRVPEEHYAEWSGRKARAAAMKDRLAEVVAIIEAGLTHTPEEYNVTPTSSRGVPESASEYLPSSQEATSGSMEAPVALLGETDRDPSFAGLAGEVASDRPQAVPEGPPDCAAPETAPPVIDLVTPSSEETPEPEQPHQVPPATTGGDQTHDEHRDATDIALPSSAQEQAHERPQETTALEVQLPALGSTATMHGGTEASAPRAPSFSIAVSLALDASPSTLFSEAATSQPSGAPSLSSPATPVEEAHLRVLMERLESTTPIPNDDPRSRILTQATTANRLAYVAWRRQLPAAERTAVGHLESLVEAASNLKDDGVTMALIARAIPYPQVWLATLPDEDIVRIGQSLSTTGTIQMLHRLASDSRMPQPAQEYCHEWAAAIAVTSPLGTQIRLSRNIERWARLRLLIPKHGPRIPVDAEFSGRFLTELDWFRLLTLLVSLPEHLPRRFRTVPMPQLCDGLAMWLLNANNIDYTAAVAKAVTNRDWEALGLLFADDDPVPSTTKTSGANKPGVSPAARARAAEGAPDRS